MKTSTSFKWPLGPISSLSTSNSIQVKSFRI